LSPGRCNTIAEQANDYEKNCKDNDLCSFGHRPLASHLCRSYRRLKTLSTKRKRYQPTKGLKNHLTGIR
jgi:hypothetical protein